MKCHLCGHDRAVEFLDLGKQPLANKYPTQAQFDSEEFFPLQMFFCPRLQERPARNHGVARTHVRRLLLPLVGQRRRSSATSSGSRHGSRTPSFVVDVGSNDGILLKPLKALGVKAIGVEPSVNVSKIANDQGLTTVCAFFDARTAAEIARHLRQGRRHRRQQRVHPSRRTARLHRCRENAARRRRKIHHRG